MTLALDSALQVRPGTHPLRGQARHDSPAGRWLVEADSRRTGRPLLIFPHAGAGPSVYRRFGLSVSGGFRPILVHLPGRENRLDDQPCRDISALVRSLCPAVVPLLASRTVFYGHSMGALVAFELARQLRRIYGIEPEHLVVSGHAAPRLPRQPRRHRLADDELWESVQALLGTPPEVAADPQVRALLLPTLRADFEVCETYRYRPEYPLDCPITSFAGEYDDEAPPPDMAGWAAETRSTFRHEILPGGHFFNLTPDGCFASRLLHALA
jgi:medium-chain acyl-[acyl-carrier-protein] hydrolase